MRWCALLVGFPLLDTTSCVTLLPNLLLNRGLPQCGSWASPFASVRRGLLRTKHYHVCKCSSRCTGNWFLDKGGGCILRCQSVSPVRILLPIQDPCKFVPDTRNPEAPRVWGEDRECGPRVFHTIGLLFNRFCWPHSWYVFTATGREAVGKGRRELFVNYCLASLPVFVRSSPWVHSVYSRKPLSQKVSNTPFRARAGNRRKQTGLALRPTQNMESWQLTQKISDSTCKLCYSQTQVTEHQCTDTSRNL